ncbi:AAEL004599-PA [Aedes aegypti]|uniref:AAEL004599-PA n=1 Tax=Aedes aegypti TaxID=7159 RepID=Q17CE0_AEDAE|nr:AAEL004599-PA [Aedes aegypti]
MLKSGGQVILIITCLGSISLAAHDSQWEDRHERSDFLENLESLKEAQDALLKLNLDSITKGRQYSNGGDFSPTINMSKEKFQNIVSKVNSEVSLLRNQALVLSKAYKDLMLKHKIALKKIDTLQVMKPISVPEKSPTPDSSQPAPVTISSSVQLPKPTPTSNCNCMEHPCGSYVIGNKYYYYNVFPGKEGMSSVPQPPWHPDQPPASPSAPIYHQPAPSHHIKSQRPTHQDGDDPDGFLSFKPRPSSSKIGMSSERTEQMQQKDKVNWKQKFFDQHDLEAVEKLFSDSETQALTEQWARLSQRRRAPKMVEI